MGSLINSGAENARRQQTVRSYPAALALSAASLVAIAPARADDRYHTTIVADPDASPEPSEDEAASASVVTSERTPHAAETLPDLVDDLPGVTVSRLGGVGAPALLSLRGSTAEQVSVYLDGVNLNLAAGGGVDLSTLPIGDVARVEVYRGATPIAFGLSAIGGVLSVETRRPRTNGAALEFGAGSFGTWLAGGSASIAGARYGVYLGLHSLRSTGDFDFTDDKGTSFDPTDDEVLERKNNRLREMDGTIRASVDLPGRRELSLIALGFDRDQGLPGYPRYATTRAELGTRRAVGSLAYRSRNEIGPRSQLRAQVYGYGLEQRFGDPLSELAVAPTDAEDQTVAAGAMTRARWVPTMWQQPAILLDVRGERFVPTDLVTGKRGVSSTRFLGAAGAETAFRHAASRLAVLPSLRVELSRGVAAGRGSFGELASAGEPVVRALPVARLAVTQSPVDAVTLRANVGRYARLPTFLELYGNTGFILGNRELEPERGVNADVGGAFAWSGDELGVSADAALFAVFTDDLIQFQQNAYGVARARNIGEARVLGVESSAALRYRDLRLYAQGTFTDAHDRSDSAAASGKQLPYRPRTHVTVRPEVRRLPLLGAEVGAHVELDVTSGNYVDPANLVRIPSRVLVGAGASLLFGTGRVRVTATATNLTDASESDLVSYPLPGRAFFLTLALATEPRPKEL